MLDRMKKALAELRGASSTVSETDSTLRTRHAAAVRERQHLLTAIAPADDVVANMRRLVAQEAERFAGERTRGIVESFSGRLEENEPGQITHVHPRLYDPRTMMAGGGLTFSDLCGLLPDVIGDRLEVIIRSANENHGVLSGNIPLAQRLDAIKAVDARIADAEAEHEAFADEAAALEPPIVIQLLEPVARRRENERQRALAEERKESARRDLEAQTDRAMARRGGGGGRSEYLQANRLDRSGRE